MPIPEEEGKPRDWLRLIESTETDPLEVMKVVGTYQRYLEAIEERAVRAARSMGRTWDEISGAMGVKKQSAWAKYEQDRAIKAVMERRPKRQ